MSDDDDDYDLFGKPYYPDRPGYVRGSSTSKAAAESLDERDLNRMQTAIRGFLKSRGLHGAIREEVKDHFGLLHNTATPRVRELILKGFAYEPGEKRLTTRKREAKIVIAIEYREQYERSRQGLK